MHFSDVVVVGSGATGSWAAKVLTEGGLDVALLEAGPVLGATHIPAEMSAAELANRPVQSRCGAFAGDARHLFVNDLENPYTNPPDAPFNWFRCQQVGGRLPIWSRHVPRIGDAGFQPSDGGECLWPLRYDQLEWHYANVEQRIGVKGEAANIPSIPDGRFSPCEPLTALERQILASLKSKYPQLDITRGRVAKFDNPFFPPPLADAAATGRLKLFPDTMATSVDEFHSFGAVLPRVRALNRVTRRIDEFVASNIVLAASAFETVRLLLHSASNCDRLSNYTLGHFISDHVFCTAGGTLAADQMRHADPRGSRHDWDFGTTTFYMPSQYSKDGSFTGKYGVQLVINPKANGRWVAAAFGEMLPRFDNCLTLHSDRKDAWGVPILNIACRHGENDVAMARGMRRHLSEIAAAAGLKEDDPSTPNPQKLALYQAMHPGGAVHEVGGARMGRSATTSVTNSTCQCWGWPNIYVVDGACFPYLPFQNPTLTMMAIADRACRHILESI